MCGGTDIIEQRTYLKYCNGAETFYSYDPARRRLQNLVVNAKAGTIMDNAYSYDAVSNVLGIKNNAPLPQSGKAGGQMSHSYTYDPLYRLASATGTYKGTDNKAASYTLSMDYDNMHRITSKKQHLSQTGVQFDGTLNAGYELAYTYGKDTGRKFQLDNVRDINYRTEETPTESTNINNGHKYEYDLNGNLVYINTSRVKKDGKEDEKASEQKFKWDEENRLLAADENGFVSNYWYDADGERTVKTSGENEAIYVNSEFSGGNTGTARFSLYVSPYLVAGQGGKYTKHIYIGSQRIVSKLGDLASYGADPRRIPYAGHEADGVTVDYKAKYSQQLQSIKDNYKTFDIPYNGEDNDDYVNGQGFCCNDGTPEAAQARAMARTRAASGNFKPNDDYEKMQFYYHPDHLGSSSYITNLDGEVSQHIEYVPFGEVFIEERNNTWNTPYLFNAKEFDEETGMYYYGARYYEPRLSLWMSCDPKQEYYPNLSVYCFTANNPILIEDVEGKSIRLTGSIEGINTYLGFLYKTTGNRYSVIDGFLVLTNTDDSFKGAKSATLANTINAGIRSSKEYSLEIVGAKKDDKSVFIDSYSERKIDASDLKKLGKASQALQGAAIGHYLHEIQVDGTFDDAHKESLLIEGIIYGELVGDKSVTRRIDYSTAPSNGFQNVIYKYDNGDTFTLVQGAVSRKTGDKVEIIPGSGLFAPVTEVNATGQLKSVTKKSQND